MHMISRKDLNSAEMETVKVSRIPILVVTTHGEVQTHEEAIVYVKELDNFLTVKVLEDTPVVLSLGKLCEDHGYSYEWALVKTMSHQKKRCSDTMQYGKLRPNRGPRVLDDFFFVKLVWLNTSNISTAGTSWVRTYSSINWM